MTWKVIVGDVRRVCRTFEDHYFDSLLADPPYGLSFMGKRWDYSVPSVNVWVEAARVLKPGAFAIMFGGTRTFHRMVTAIEDAGFIPCDLLMWLYGQGFPKSLDISKGIDKKAGHWRGRAGKPLAEDSKRSLGQHYECTPKGDPTTDDRRRWSGYGTALKPAYEPALLCCTWSPDNIVDTALRHGVGGLDLDGCRIGSVERFNAPAGNTGNTPASNAPVNVTGYGGSTVKGRWPANVVLSHHPDCREVGTRRVATGTAVRHRGVSGGTGASFSIEKPPGTPDTGFGDADGTEEIPDCKCHPDCPVGMIDQQSGDRPGMSGGGRHRDGYGGGMFGAIDSPGTARGDRGGASRFFYVAKAARAERDRGLEGAPSVPQGADSIRDGGRSQHRQVLNDHPTCKPLEICRYFARLLLPPPHLDGTPRRLLVPYSGSGSEMIGALQAGWDEVVGIELDPRHADKARTRIARGAIIRHAA